MPAWSIELVLGLLTTVFSLVISHVGATIVMVPLAINLGIASGGNPTVFALVAALSGSNNIVTLSNPVIAMISGPAGYTTTKLLRVGLPLVLAYIALTVLAVNLLY
jgi:di/tricarboxylate transporter